MTDFTKIEADEVPDPYYGDLQAESMSSTMEDACSGLLIP